MVTLDMVYSAHRQGTTWSQEGVQPANRTYAARARLPLLPRGESRGLRYLGVGLTTTAEPEALSVASAQRATSGRCIVGAEQPGAGGSPARGKSWSDESVGLTPLALV